MREECLPVPSETTELRAVTLQQLRAAQSERLAAEAVEERGARLQ